MKTTVTKLYKTIHLFPLSPQKSWPVLLLNTENHFWQWFLESLTGEIAMLDYTKFWTSAALAYLRLQFWNAEPLTRKCKAPVFSLKEIYLTFLGYLKQLKSNSRIPIGLPIQKPDCNIRTYFLFLETIPFSNRQNTVLFPSCFMHSEAWKHCTF